MTADLTVLLGEAALRRDGSRWAAKGHKSPVPAGGAFDVVAYCDGSLVSAGRLPDGRWSGQGGWGVAWWALTAPRSPEGWCGCAGPCGSSSAAELVAVGHAVRRAPPGRLLVRTDSEVALRWLQNPSPWAACDRAVLESVRAAMAARDAPVVLQWVRGHAQEVGNCLADRLARQGARVGEPGWPWGAGRRPVRAGPLPSPQLGALAPA